MGAVHACSRPPNPILLTVVTTLTPAGMSVKATIPVVPVVLDPYNARFWRVPVQTMNRSRDWVARFGCTLIEPAAPSCARSAGGRNIGDTITTMSASLREALWLNHVVFIENSPRQCFLASESSATRSSGSLSRRCREAKAHPGRVGNCSAKQVQREHPPPERRISGLLT